MKEEGEERPLLNSAIPQYTYRIRGKVYRNKTEFPDTFPNELYEFLTTEEYFRCLSQIKEATEIPRIIDFIFYFLIIVVAVAINIAVYYIFDLIHIGVIVGALIASLFILAFPFSRVYFKARKNSLTRTELVIDNLNELYRPRGISWFLVWDDEFYIDVTVPNINHNPLPAPPPPSSSSSSSLPTSYHNGYDNQPSYPYSNNYGTLLTSSASSSYSSSAQMYQLPENENEMKNKYVTSSPLNLQSSSATINISGGNDDDLPPLPPSYSENTTMFTIVE